MPQLDRTIIFTQFFWLFLVFLVFYGLLSYYFLPFFLKSIKSRFLIIEQNQLEDEKVKLLYLSKQSVLSKTLNESLLSIKFMFFNGFMLLDDSKDLLQNLYKIDTYVLSSTFFIILYCNVNILNIIPLIPKIYTTN
uniref:ATP synthase F0 subunit 8 n=1 Tax=Kumanoa ambigua TaxID=644273 RepID=A0A343UXV1_9FLOR|nr:ATP synthase F0 subunit 8 [Kumanoa ambigua]AVK39508.1 ATP synthase F0 subunit 8 [Kumanoa ambigua]